RELPELPGATRARFERDFGLNDYEAGLLSASREWADFYEALVRQLGGGHKLAASWMLGEFSAALNRAGIDISASPVSSARSAGLRKNIESNKITRKSAGEVFDAMWNGSLEADAIIQSRGLSQISDSTEIEKLVETIIAANPAQVAEFRAGKQKALNFFVGQAMKASGGKANPGQVNEILRRKLSQ